MSELSDERASDVTGATGAAGAAARETDGAGTTGAIHGADGATSDREYWEERYGSDERVWSGRPNALLPTETDALMPGRALDLGCGEGGDTVWLAQHGWHVTATDISANALRRTAEYAAEMGVADRVECVRHELGQTFPEGRFDLVSSFFLHSWGMPDREGILRRAAEAVAPGGTLLIVGHVRVPGSDHQHDDHQHDDDQHPPVDLPTAAEVLAGLRLAEGEWEVVRCAEYETTHHDGAPRTDGVVRARRLPT